MRRLSALLMLALLYPLHTKAQQQELESKYGKMYDIGRQAEAQVPASAPSCHVVGVTDGDTITVRCGAGEQMKVRLAEIDAPESGQPWGQQAKKQLSELVFDKDVLVETVDRDRYGRTVANIYVMGSNVQKKLLLTGFAWCYDDYAKHDWCEDLESKARARRVNIWSEQSPVPPWEFRKAKK